MSKQEKEPDRFVLFKQQKKKMKQADGTEPSFVLLCPPVPCEKRLPWKRPVYQNYSSHSVRNKQEGLLQQEVVSHSRLTEARSGRSQMMFAEVGKSSDANIRAILWGNKLTIIAFSLHRLVSDS